MRYQRSRPLLPDIRLVQGRRPILCDPVVVVLTTIVTMMAVLFHGRNNIHYYYAHYNTNVQRSISQVVVTGWTLPNPVHATSKRPRASGQKPTTTLSGRKTFTLYPVRRFNGQQPPQKLYSSSSDGGNPMSVLDETTTTTSSSSSSSSVALLKPLPSTPYDDGQRPYQITTPIYYVNDKPHIGHAYTSTGKDTNTFLVVVLFCPSSSLATCGMWTFCRIMEDVPDSLFVLFFIYIYIQHNLHSPDTR